jgi:hypothetical protein
MNRRRIFITGTLTPEILRSWLSYDSETGEFRWARKPNGGPRKKGVIAGHTKGCGYVTIGLLGKNYKAHRLAWFYVHGNWPRHFIDHIDGNRGNNAIRNLREASDIDNARNAVARGYIVDRKRCPNRPYHAKIRVLNRAIGLGYYATAEEARAAYLAGTKKYFGEFSAAHSRALSSEKSNHLSPLRSMGSTLNGCSAEALGSQPIASVREGV